MNIKHLRERFGTDGRKNCKKKVTIKYRFTDYRVFPIVMQDETICRQLLELILDKKIGIVRFDDENTFNEISMEKTLMKGPALKAVKLDVFVTDEQAWYNVEMLCYMDKDLPKRSRMYQAEIDSDRLKGGQPYSELRDSYIIFICNYDPFGRGKAVYRFQYTENDEKDLYLGDGTYKIYLNTACAEEAIPDDMKNLFRYIRNMKVARGDELVTRIHKSVENLNKGDKEGPMHTMYDFVKEREQAMFEEGQIAGEKRGRLEGEKIGEKRGRLEGEMVKQKSIAARMLAMGMDIAMISEATGLTEDEIKKLSGGQANNG